MSLVRRNPWSLTSSLPTAFETEMEDLMRRFFAPSGMSAGKWAPPARVEERPADITVTAELPGIDPKDVTISVEGRDLLVSGEKKEHKTEKGATCHYDQTVTGSFFLRLTLPTEVVADKTSADYRDGLLRVTLPKALSTKRATIPITVGK